MGSAILAGVFRKKICPSKNVWIADKFPAKAREFCRKTGSCFVDSAAEAVQKADVILLAVKPQDFIETAASIRPYLNKSKTVISILAGVKIAGLKKQLGKAVIVRTMPNLGAQTGEAMTAVCSENRAALSKAQKIFSACGKTIVLKEKYFDALTAASGSGPAYFFLVMELIEAFAVKSGIDAQSARILAVQTAVGAASAAAASDESPAVLRERVTSKKGTTDAALTVLKSRGFPAIFFAALNAASKRSRELSK